MQSFSMPDLLVIADSGPLIAFAGVQCLDLLPQLYRRAAAPRAVIEEIMAGAHLSPRHNFLHQISWLEQLEAPVPLDALAIVLGRGEAEAIVLARHYPGALLLLDDRQARRAAEAPGLAATGSAGVLVRAKREGLIAAVRPFLRSMRNNGYYMSDRVIQRACQMAGEIDV
jgi:predicted nucleic acid-binding protein